MATKENLRPITPAPRNEQHTPPGTASNGKPFRPWFLPAFSSPVPRSRPANQGHDPSRGRPDSPLKVRKTRENLRETRPTSRPSTPPTSIASTENRDSHSERLTAAPRDRSVSRRVLNRVRESIGNRTRSAYSVRSHDSEASLVRLVSGRVRACDDITETSADPSIARSSTSSSVPASDSSQPAPKFSPPRIPRRSASHAALSTPSPGSSASPEPTPRPKTSAAERAFVSNRAASVIRAVVPHVVLNVDVEYPAIDASLERDVWVAVQAAVHTKSTSAIADDLLASDSRVNGDASHSYTCGTISSLRLCYRPTDGCQIIDVVGHKTLKNLQPRQDCTLFLRVRIPPLDQTHPASRDRPDNLFSELESMVGIFETNLLALEARYRHTLLPYDSIITVRQTVSTRRPKTDLHWSAIEDDDQIPAAVHEKLAAYLETEYEPAKALKLIDRYLTPDQLDEAGVQLVRQRLEAGLHRSDSAIGHMRSASEEGGGVTTDSNTDQTLSSVVDNSPPPPPYSSPTGPLSPTFPAVPPRSTSRNRVPCAAAVPIRTSSSSVLLPSHVEREQDEARRLWSHIRRSSLTTNQLADLARASDLSEVAEIEDEDESVKALRHQALSNKRSVGVETLRAWKWEAKTTQS